MFPKGKKYNLKAYTEQINLLIDLNKSEILTYNSYLIATFSISITLFIALLSTNISSKLIFYPLFFIISLIIYFIIKKIRLIRNLNERLVEGYNVVQSRRAGCSLLLIEGPEKEVMKRLKEASKISGVEGGPYDPFTGKK